jgi:hypothetical protein
MRGADERFGLSRSCMCASGSSSKEIDAIANARHHVSGGMTIVFCYPREDTVEIVLRGFADDDFHTP